ncbi:uncharacterized protein LOC130789677 [Actinidia eriantha]|uniref:uncharacterized protein LOC130789677 n=1 Tax=Actinidia eriantha TaxID=165200 RepID=UPI002586F813|nr:uncharacterized protein LOC130789677 [Actinidia eriantha]
MSGRIPTLKNKAPAHEEDSSEDDEDFGNDLGISLERLNLGPRKKLVVMGLGGVLVHRMYRFDHKTNFQKHRFADAIAGNFLVFNRPFCDEFLKFCFERFEVGIWSSARERNIDGVLNSLTRGLKDKLLFVWDQEECTDSGFKSLEKKEKPIFFKELRKLWEDGKFSSSNTLLIDDEPYKALLNPPNTAIFPPTYKVDNGDDTALGPNSELRIFLDGLVDAEDVPSYVKDYQIGQPPITEAHSDWEFYSKIVRRFR